MVLRNEEQRIIAEAATASRLADNDAVAAPFGDGTLHCVVARQC